MFNEFVNESSDPTSYFRDISTYGGCAGSAAAGVANIKVIEDDKLVENSKIVGAYFLEQLNDKLGSHKNVGEIRGVGLFTGVELVVDRKSREALPEGKLAEIVGHCMQNGVIIGRTNRSLPKLNNTLTFCPALIATKEDIDTIVQSVIAAMTAILGQ